MKKKLIGILALAIGSLATPALAYTCADGKNEVATAKQRVANAKTALRACQRRRVPGKNMECSVEQAEFHAAEGALAIVQKAADDACEDQKAEQKRKKDGRDRDGAPKG